MRVTTLHVIPDERGNWRLFDERRSTAVSEHNSATEAERSAWAQLRPRDAREIVVHDRYGRTRPPVRYRPSGPRARHPQEPDDVILGLA